MSRASAALAKLIANGDLLHRILHGNDTATVVTDSGSIPSISKALKDTLYIKGSRTPRNLTRWRKALAGVRAGSQRARVMCVGDSTTMGWGANTGTLGLTNARAFSYPTFLAATLTGMGIPCNVQSVWGDAYVFQSSTSVEYGVYDPRVTLPSDWLRGSGVLYFTVGGTLFRSPNTVTSVWKFLPQGNVDTFVVHLAKSAGNAVMSMALDGGAALATLDTNVVTGAIGTQTITTTLGAHELNVRRVSGGSGFIIGVEAYDSTVKKVDIFNMGAAGWKAGDWNYAVNAWSPLKALEYLNPDLTIINVGINDWKDIPTALATYIANMQAIINSSVLNGGSVVMFVPFPSQTTRASVAQQRTFYAALRDLALSNNVILVDLEDRYGDYATSSAAGFAYNDLHPNALGYADMAHSLVSTLLV